MANCGISGSLEAIGLASLYTSLFWTVFYISGSIGFNSVSAFFDNEFSEFSLSSSLGDVWVSGLVVSFTVTLISNVVCGKPISSDANPCTGIPAVGHARPVVSSLRNRHARRQQTPLEAQRVPTMDGPCSYLRFQRYLSWFSIIWIGFIIFRLSMWKPNAADRPAVSLLLHGMFLIVSTVWPHAVDFVVARQSPLLDSRTRSGIHCECFLHRRSVQIDADDGAGTLENSTCHRININGPSLDPSTRQLQHGHRPLGDPVAHSGVLSSVGCSTVRRHVSTIAADEEGGSENERTPLLGSEHSRSKPSAPVSFTAGERDSSGSRGSQISSFSTSPAIPVPGPSRREVKRVTIDAVRTGATDPSADEASSSGAGLVSFPDSSSTMSSPYGTPVDSSGMEFFMDHLARHNGNMGGATATTGPGNDPSSNSMVIDVDTLRRTQSMPPSFQSSIHHPNQQSSAHDSSLGNHHPPTNPQDPSSSVTPCGGISGMLGGGPSQQVSPGDEGRGSEQDLSTPIDPRLQGDPVWKRYRLIGIHCSECVLHECSLAPNGIWQFSSEKQGVRIYTKRARLDEILCGTEFYEPVSNSSTDDLQIILGVKRMNVAARSLVDVLVDSTIRKRWDKMFIEGRPVFPEIRESTTCGFRVAYSAFSAPWPTSDRDFVFVLRFEVLSDGRVLISARSCDLDPSHADDVRDSVTFSNRVRGRLLLSGYVITPLSDHTCECSFLSLVDPCGSIPKKVKEIVAYRTPMQLVNLEEVARSITASKQ